MVVGLYSYTPQSSSLEGFRILTVLVAILFGYLLFFGSSFFLRSCRERKEEATGRLDLIDFGYFDDSFFRQRSSGSFGEVLFHGQEHNPDEVLLCLNMLAEGAKT